MLRGLCIGTAVLAVLAVASAVGTRICQAAEEWVYATESEPSESGSCSTHDSSDGVLIAYCYQKDITCPDYVGLAVRVVAGTMDEGAESWLAIDGLDEEGAMALNLLASLRPIAVWAQLFRIMEYTCVLDAGQVEGCSLPQEPSAFSEVVSSRHYQSVGMQTRGWSVDSWRADGAVLTHEFANGILFLFVPGTHTLSISYSLAIWDDGLDSWNDGGSSLASQISVYCSLIDLQ
jgi:hypothetical protein